MKNTLKKIQTLVTTVLLVVVSYSVSYGQFILRQNTATLPSNTTPSILFESGNSIGLGNSNNTPQPAGVGLHINRPTSPIGGQPFFNGTISNNTTDFLRLSNVSGGNDFLPAMVGQSDGRVGLFLLANTSLTNDVSGNTSPLMVFSSSKGWVQSQTPATTIQNRPLFSWQNAGTTLMQMAPNGNLSLGTGNNPANARLFVYKNDNPNIRIQSGTPTTTGGNVLELAVSTCNGCFAGTAKLGDAVIRQLSNIGSGDLILNIPTDRNATAFTRSVRISEDVSNIFSVLNGGNTDDGGRVVIGDISNGTSNGIVKGYKLYVQTGILTEKVKVAMKSSTHWADYVFADDYKLKPLNEIETFVKTNKHLPNVPSADELVKNGGIDVNEMFAKQMEKIEELTLYIIEQNKQMETLKTRISQLEKH